MRYSRSWYCGAQIAALGVVGVASLVVLWMMPREMIAAKGAILAIASAVAVVVGLAAYRRADEVILHVHKTAWFWGSMAIYAVLAPLLVGLLLNLVPAPQLLPFSHRTPADWFAEGAVCVMALQSLGFAAVWAYLNFARRR